MTRNRYQAAGPGARVRPRTVSVALAVLFAAVALLVLLAWLALAKALHTRVLIGRAAAASGTTGGVVAEERSFTAVFTAVVIMVLMAMAAYYAGFAVPLSRGRNYARVVIWAGVGVPLVTLLFCGLGGLLFWATNPGPAPAADPAEARFREELDRLHAEEPAVWIDVSIVGAGLLLLGALTVVVVLLWTPSSNRYFRPRRPAPSRRLPVYAYPLFPPPYSGQIAPPAAGRSQ